MGSAGQAAPEDVVAGVEDDALAGGDAAVGLAEVRDRAVEGGGHGDAVGAALDEHGAGHRLVDPRQSPHRDLVDEQVVGRADGDDPASGVDVDRVAPLARAPTEPAALTDGDELDGRVDDDFEDESDDELDEDEDFSRMSTDPVLAYDDYRRKEKRLELIFKTSRPDLNIGDPVTLNFEQPESGAK